MFNLFTPKVKLVPYSIEYLSKHLEKETVDELVGKYLTSRGCIEVPDSIRLYKSLKIGYKNNHLSDTVFEDTDGKVYGLTNRYVWKQVDRSQLWKSKPYMNIRVMSPNGSIMDEGYISKKWGWTKFELDNGEIYDVSSITLNLDGESRSNSYTFMMQIIDIEELNHSLDLYWDYYPVSHLPKEVSPTEVISLGGNSRYISKLNANPIIGNLYMQHNIHQLDVNERVLVERVDDIGYTYQTEVETVTGCEGTIILKSGLKLPIRNLRVGGIFKLKDNSQYKLFKL